MKPATHHRIRLGGRRIDYRVVCSKAATKLRVRVGLDGVEVVQPAARTGEEVSAFLDRNAAWVLDQLRRVESLHRVRRPTRIRPGSLLFLGEPTQIRIETTDTRARGNAVSFANGEIVIQRGDTSHTSIVKSLERWLRKQARRTIEQHLVEITARLGEQPGRLYVMEQRTKWGNCSARRNLSFNWRLVLAPDFVLQYLVTHEAVHLAVPDHSAKFWLTVQSLCPETERAKQWLCRHQPQLMVDLGSVLNCTSEAERRAGQ